MAGPMSSNPHAQGYYHCNLCGCLFLSQKFYMEHLQTHPGVQPLHLVCPVCRRSFEDAKAIESHMMSVHGNTETSMQQISLPVSSPTIAIPAPSVPGQTSPQTSTKQHHCNRCGQDFPSKTQFRKHRSFPDGPCADHNVKKTSQNAGNGVNRKNDEKPHKLNGPQDEIECDEFSIISMASILPDGSKLCHKCNKISNSAATYNNHLLSCATATRHEASNSDPVRASDREMISIKNVPQTGHYYLNIQLKTKPPVPVQRPIANRPMPGPLQTQAEMGPTTMSVSSAAPSSPTNEHVICDWLDCGRCFRSELALNSHKRDVHGSSEKGLDLAGKEAGMLNQRIRRELQNIGLLECSNGATHARKVSSPPPLPSTRSLGSSTYLRQPLMTTPKSASGAIIPHQSSITSALPHTSMNKDEHAVQSTTFRPNKPEVKSDNLKEFEEAKRIQGAIMRLLIQTDIQIQHDGKIIVSGIPFLRIRSTKHEEAVAMFEQLCHLPKRLQNEYVPPPKTFKDEYVKRYLVNDFKNSPDPDPEKPGLRIVVLACGKIILDDDCQEVVKIAAVDLLTCRILINHLVCTNPKASVKDWRSKDTGLGSWNDMEAARQSGYKIFKGWSAVRSALWKFVDKETVIVGHNLRSDLDALRMIHGKAVDVVKTVEKAAQGPMSKKQMSLDSLVHDFAGVHLSRDADFGRDTLVDAFGVRELGLWICADKERFEKGARQKSLDYQRLLSGSEGFMGSAE